MNNEYGHLARVLQGGGGSPLCDDRILREESRNGSSTNTPSVMREAVAMIMRGGPEAPA